MKFKIRRVTAELAAEIARKMALAGWSVPEMARFLGLWHTSDRTVSLMAWLSRPEDDLDKQTFVFIRPFLVDDEP